ncbi:MULTISPECIES: penicillin-insensitive murein endopeptidase [unclassified Aureimonas]|uniref:penicillin-insensitive murein endopeptidase n=1 Tax=unclassified Aureimonas TaxID=2615206 RepID=UPI0006FEB6FF|nr:MULTISPECIES: penicillin-insensitive murein endopeptidase [unclassified Aureimonas]KQT64215.1 peptidase [Aureimonas sp. Leaf427]KQT81405.1 peptidase [Aureimonas sp. Leaf460]
MMFDRPSRIAALAAFLALAATLPVKAETAARDLFGAKTQPSAQGSEAYGFYSHGCLAGGVGMPKNGETWQVMKPSRNRAWGHPALIAFLQRLSREAAAEDNWRGLLFGDMAQPRGGPMKNGHASHQIGLDADIYLTEMPNRRLTDDERDNMDLPSVIDPRTKHVDERRWRPEMLKLIRTAARSPEVQRIFVNPGIKEKLCKTATGDRKWLNKVRPMYGHDYHFHVRMYCQPGESGCEPQESTGGAEGCDLDWWFNVALKPPKPGAKPPKPRPPMTMAALPNACRSVLAAPARDGGTAVAARRASPPQEMAPSDSEVPPEAPQAMPAMAQTPSPLRSSFAPVPPAAVPIPGSRPLQ